MKTTLKMVCVAVLTLGLFVGNATATGVPTIDIAGLTQDQVNQAANIAKYVEMIDSYKTQITQMKQQYESMSGSRGLGSLLNDPQYANYLPDDWKKVYSGVKNGRYKGLSGTAAAIRDGSKVLDLCDGTKDAQAEQVCRQKADKASADQGFASDAYDKATARWDQIQGLIEEINSTTDAKAIAELQARINGETASLQNEATKMQMYAMMSAAQDKILEQQQREATVKSMRESKYVELKPLEYRK
ncbi:P-type DNA transfer protein VirB5 [Xanthomonas arboricola]|uniref:P-type DNA transfer protein VirB5 n=1 Tax=Xanthomonas arboricola TaxID=56448 RepID=UPI0015E313D4|nr:P-type DNA transfer protein VirB5 [Xanthomonas arboricola]